MLTRTQLIFGLGLMLSGCTGTCVVNGDGEGGGGEGGATTTATTTTGGGGEAQGGGGTGGMGQGGAGGGAGCVGPDGTGTVAAACDQTNLGLHGTCPSTQEDPVGLPVCHRGFEIFTAGSAENLLECLGQIPASFEEACDEPQASMNVAQCVDKVYDEACANPDSAALCDQIFDTCQMAGQVFPLNECVADLNPMGQAGLAEYVDCYNNGPTELQCDAIHNYCYGVLFSF